MLFGCLEAVAHNHNRQSLDVSLFEFGRTYEKSGDDYKETDHLALVMTGAYRPNSWKATDTKSDFHTIKGVVNHLLTRMGIKSYKVRETEGNTFEYGLQYLSGKDTLVSFGKVDSDLLAKMDVKRDVFYADINWNLLTQRRNKKAVVFESLNKFPIVKRDLAVVLDEQVNFEDLATIARKTGKKLLKSIDLFDVYKNAKQLGEGKKSYALSMVFEDKEQTLKDKQVEKIMNELIRRYESELGAIIRS